MIKLLVRGQSFMVKIYKGNLVAFNCAVKILKLMFLQLSLRVKEKN